MLHGAHLSVGGPPDGLPPLQCALLGVAHHELLQHRRHDQVEDYVVGGQEVAGVEECGDRRRLR